MERAGKEERGGRAWDGEDGRRHRQRLTQGTGQDILTASKYLSACDFVVSIIAHDNSMALRVQAPNKQQQGRTSLQLAAMSPFQC